MTRASRRTVPLDPEWHASTRGGTPVLVVARQYSGTLGKIGNRRIGVSVNAVTDSASCPLDRCLFLP
ncbi:SRSO17 transposase [Paeniglutamicibacter kerguelensis]|uniref:SRSO17 transposase n=1 Tax=Paeniglutamicibacter kerguelensis TaxID=254788 RepID=A0ABS4XCS0_9MICC|nr:SRSO17 transposase [Paeniglutamicibacter kerguelensis]